MRGIDLSPRPDVATRLLAGVTVPDTAPISRAIEFAREHSQPFLFNHAMRSWLFAAALAQLNQTAHDGEVLAVTTILHDFSSTEGFDGPLRFDVEGANAARAFYLDECLDERRTQLISDEVELNSTPSISLCNEAEVALATRGIGLDWGGWGYEAIPEARVAEIIEAFPRLGMKERFNLAVCRVVETRPTTTYDTLARDLGECFVPVSSRRRQWIIC